MANNLFPSGYETETIDAQAVLNDGPIGYRPGVAFSLKTGDFVRDGKNKLTDSTGIESWKSWCTNCLQTERYAHLAYSSDFGIEYEKAFAAESREEAESILTRQITEALAADPYGRTAYVEDIKFDWIAPNAVQVSATVVGIDDVSVDLTAYMQGGEA